MGAQCHECYIQGQLPAAAGAHVALQRPECHRVIWVAGQRAGWALCWLQPVWTLGPQQPCCSSCEGLSDDEAVGATQMPLPGRGMGQAEEPVGAEGYGASLPTPLPPATCAHWVENGQNRQALPACM